jgi:hypothetical protein
VPERSTSYRKIFASYSHQDARIVSDFDSVISALGDRYLVDVRDLRSGEIWNDALERLIDEADIFQLFWSTSSMRSEFCRREWEYALARRKQIRPVFWEQPMPRDEQSGLPPAALAALHFAQLGAAMSPANDSVAPPEGSEVDVSPLRAKRWRGLAVAASGVAMLLLVGSLAMQHGAGPDPMVADGREAGTGVRVKDDGGVGSPLGVGGSSAVPTVALSAEPTPIVTPPTKPSAVRLDKACYVQRSDPWRVSDSPRCRPRNMTIDSRAELRDPLTGALTHKACSRVIRYDCDRVVMDPIAE